MSESTSRDPLSLVFAALADPTRRKILARLSFGSSTVGEIAAEFRETMSLPAVTKHLKVLERAKLISKTKDAQFRPCQIDAAALKEALDWLEPYRVHWEARLDRLEAYLARTAARPDHESSAPKTPKTHKQKSPKKGRSHA